MRFTFSAPAFSTMDTSSGIEQLPPRVNKSDICRPYFIENGRVTSIGGISIRPGFELDATPSAAKIDTLRALQTYDVMFAKSGTKIYAGTLAQWEADEEWDIGVTRTAARRDYLFPNGKNMYSTNYTDAYLRIATSKIAVAIVAGNTTITIKTGDISQFTASGSVVVNGTTYDYTGRNTGASTLTTVTEGGGAITTAQPIDSIIVQTSTPSSAPKGTCIAEFQNRIMVGGEQITNPATLFHSATYTTANPELEYDFTTSPAGSKPMPFAVTALMGSERALLIGMKKGIAIGTSFVSNALVHDLVHPTHGVPNAFCMAQMDKDVAVVTNEGRVLRYGQSDAGYVLLEDPNKPRTAMDYAIQKYVRDNRDADQSLAFSYANQDRKELVASIIIGGLSQEFVYQWESGNWCVDTTKNHACKEYFGGFTFAGADDTSGEVYKDNVGLLDNLNPITMRITTGKFRLGSAVTGDWLQETFTGIMNDVGQILFSILINDNDISGSPFTVNATDLVANGLMDATGSLIPIGAGVFGANNIGSGGIPVEGYKFSYNFEMGEEGELCQLIFETSDEATFFELRSLSLEGETEGILYRNTPPFA